MGKYHQKFTFNVAKWPSFNGCWHAHNRIFYKSDAPLNHTHTKSFKETCGKKFNFQNCIFSAGLFLVLTLYNDGASLASHNILCTLYFDRRCCDLPKQMWNARDKVQG